MANEQLGVDISITNPTFDITIDAQNSFVFIEDEANLLQAMFSQLATKLGEMELHVDYGSGLYSLEGMPNTQLTLINAELVAQESLLKEPRIDEILDVTAEFDLSNNKQINLSVSVLPVNQTTPLNLVFPLFI